MFLGPRLYDFNVVPVQESKTITAREVMHFQPKVTVQQLALRQRSKFLSNGLTLFHGYPVIGDHRKTGDPTLVLQRTTTRQPYNACNDCPASQCDLVVESRHAIAEPTAVQTPPQYMCSCVSIVEQGTEKLKQRRVWGEASVTNIKKDRGPIVA